LLLLKVLVIFNSDVFHERTVFYAPHHSHTSIQWKKIRNNHQTVLTELNRGKKSFYSSRRSRGYENAKNGAKMTKLWLKQVLALICI
jgi:hypothetical protein